ncbi:MAG TPA: ABC transporter permease [Candidatus Saccharimonadales bacterium]|nr:ABC transporter permease [Candidatus Saccharimonadales bacterium]
MSPRRTLATTVRVLKQLGHDRRTLALLFVMPCVLMGLLAWIFANTGNFDQIGASLLGIFPVMMMFIVTSIATLRERTAGTMERLLAMPITKLDFLGGYALAFGLVAMLQTLLVSTFAVYVYDLDVAGPLWLVIIAALAAAFMGTALGLFASAFARTEFQASQFMPAFFLPQLLLCGLFVPAAQLPNALEFVSYGLPLTYAVDAMQRISIEAAPSGIIWRGIAIVFGFAAVAVVLGAVTLRRSTK